MERFRNHTHFIPLKDDTSRLELLPIESEVGSFISPSVKDGQDSAEGQSRKRTREIQRWPQSSKTLRKTGWKKAGSLTIDIFIALIPLVFTGKSQTARGPCHRTAQKRCTLANEESPEHRRCKVVRYANFTWWRQN